MMSLLFCQTFKTLAINIILIPIPTLIFLIISKLMQSINQIFSKIDGFLEIKRLLFKIILIANMVVNSAITINLVFNKYKELHKIRIKILTS